MRACPGGLLLLLLGRAACLCVRTHWAPFAVPAPAGPGAARLRAASLARCDTAGGMHEGGASGMTAVSSAAAGNSEWSRDAAKSAAAAAGWVYSFNVGVEAEAAGRAPTKSFVALRRDLAMLPWVLAGPEDIVLAPQPRPQFLASLRDAGVTGLPTFVERVPEGRAVAGCRPFGVAGGHMRRSAVARYRSDVSVCRSMAEVRQAVAAHHKAVLKAEFSSSGLGVRVCEGAAALEPGAPLEQWVQERLRQDGVLTVEPWLQLLAEVSAEWLNGAWMSVSQPIVGQMRWEGQWLGDPVDGGMCQEAADFVFKERAVEAALAQLEVPATCGAETCGMDIAIVRAGGGFGNKACGALPLEVRVLELNARYTYW